MVEIIKLSPPPYKELAILLNDSFTERLAEGLNFACASSDENFVKKKLSKNAVVFGAYNENKLVGMLVLNSIRKRFGIKYGNHEYLAVASSQKRQGIGTSMLSELVIEARNQDLDFILSDTAIQATSSVKYHQKNGFKIFGKSHYEARTYDSFNFVLPLSFKGKFLASWIGRKFLRFFFSRKEE